MLKKCFKSAFICMLASIVFISFPVKISASQKVEASKNISYFGKLTGTLEKGYAIDRYQMEFSVNVENALSNGYIRANVETYDYRSGNYLGDEKTDTVWGENMTYWYYEFFNIGDTSSYSNKYLMYGCHEAIYTYGEAVYTSNTYCYAEE